MHRMIQCTGRSIPFSLWKPLKGSAELAGCSSRTRRPSEGYYCTPISVLPGQEALCGVLYPWENSTCGALCPFELLS